MQLIANISMMFTEVPLVERFDAAARAGFDGVEIQFPYDVEAEVLRRAAGDLPVVLINAPALDSRGGNGRAADAAERGAFASGLEDAVRYADILRVEKLNVLAGVPPLGQADSVTARVFSDNVGQAADLMDEIGVATVVEAINPFDMPGFWLDGLDKALRFLAGQGDDRVGFQFDLYHMARTEPDLVEAIRRAGSRIGHVQFADNPGRHEPGTGTLDLGAAIRAVREVGYEGALAAEYRPAARTEDGLGWIRSVRAWAAGRRA